MKKLSLNLWLIACLTLCIEAALAAPTGASVNPLSRTLSDSANNSFAVSWNITTDGARGNVTSNNASLINNANNAVLGNTGGVLSANGTGPFTLNETVMISRSQVNTWQGQGITRVLLRRTFGDVGGGPTVTGTMTLNIPVPAVILSLTAASVSPAQSNLSTSINNSIRLSWQVSAQAGFNNGVTSNSRSLINSANNALLSSGGANLTASGTAPYTIAETVSISSAQVNTWQAQGISRVLVRRTFTDPVNGSSVTATAQLVIPAFVPAVSAIVSASSTPSQQSLIAARNNAVRLTWRVAADPAHTNGVTSTSGGLFNANTGERLGSAGSNLNAGGSGPFTLTEVVNISASQISSWQARGIQRVALRRTFDAPAATSTATAEALLLVPARAEFKGSRVSPMQRQLYGTVDNYFNANWQIVADANYNNGVVSTFYQVINPTNGAELVRVSDTLSASGAGPFLFSEGVTLDSALVQNWLNQGLRRVILTRSFNDPVGGANTEASMTLLLSRSNLQAARNGVAGSLSVQGLRLEFATGNNLAVTTVDTPLQAKLTVVHSGTGVLEGRWQIADPGSSEANPLYRTLTLVRKNLVANQRTVIQSPELPASRTGKYLMRFCVTNRDMINDNTIADGQCPIEQLLVTAAYQVQPANNYSTAANAGLIQGLSPNQQAIDKDSEFSWPAVAGASSYQLQLFALPITEVNLPSSRRSDKPSEPKFVTGMVIPATSTRTTLSELVRIRLQAGQRYLWRISAFDKQGKLIASSAEPTFIYQPDNQ